MDDVKYALEEMNVTDYSRNDLTKLTKILGIKPKSVKKADKISALLDFYSKQNCVQRYVYL